MFDLDQVNVNELFANNSGASKLKKYHNPFARDGKKASKNRINKQKGKSRILKYKQSK